MLNKGRFPVLGIHIHAVDYEEAVDQIIGAAREQKPFTVSALAVHGVMTGFQDPEHGYRLNHFDLVVPDGQPVRWALRWLHHISLPDRVYGPTLTLKVCERAAAEGLAVFFYGSTPEVLEKLRENLTQFYPALTIAGTQASQFKQLTPTEQESALEAIKASGAQIVFAGLGCPRQEVWAYENRSHLTVPILAVGAAFDFHAGTLDQAPSWMQSSGLEWVFRLLKEPTRLWKRYMILNPLYLSKLLAVKVGFLSFSEDSFHEPTERKRYG